MIFIQAPKKSCIKLANIENILYKIARHLQQNNKPSVIIFSARQFNNVYIALCPLLVSRQITYSKHNFSRHHVYNLSKFDTRYLCIYNYKYLLFYSLGTAFKNTIHCSLSGHVNRLPVNFQTFDKV